MSLSSDMSEEVSSESEEDSSENTTLFPTAISYLFPNNGSPNEFYIVVTITSIVFAVISIAIVYLITKSLVNVCCSLPNTKNGHEVYISVPNDEVATPMNTNYNSVLSIQSQSVNVHSNLNTVMSDDSEYDNLSLNPVLRDSDCLETPPEYEHPPPYEPPGITQMFSKLS